METQQTFFIQCNREMSVIDNEDPELNSIWTTNLGTAGFQLQRGDVIYLDSASLQVVGSSDANSTMEFTGDNQIVDGKIQPFTDDRVLIEFGYTLNQNMPQGYSGYSLGLPLNLPGSNYLSNAQQVAVNEGDYALTPNLGFNFFGNNNFIIYGMLSESNVFTNTLVFGSSIQTLYLCDTGDPISAVDASGVGINFGSAAFKWKVGMNIQYIPENDPYITYTVGPISSIDQSGNRFAINFAPQADGTYPTIVANTPAPVSGNFVGRVAASVNFPRSNLGMGLFNASHNTGATTDNGSYFYDMTKEWLSSDGVRGFRNKNRRQGYDNLPYCLVRNDFQGCQPTPNAMKMSPKLKPLTSFCLLEIDKNLTNVNDVAVSLSKQLQQLSPVWGSQKSVINYLKDKTKKQKGNSVVPYVAANGFVPGSAVGGAVWNDIAKIFTSNTCKCIPANLQLGQDKFNTIDLNVKLNSNPDAVNYLHSGTQPNEFPEYWNNQIYGNHGVQNIYRAMAGDTINRLQVWNGNIIKTTIPQQIILERNMQRVCILNTSIATHSVMVDNSGGTFEISGSYIPENGAIFTNIVYNEQNIKDIADAFDNGSTYDGIYNTWKEQLLDVDGWYFFADVGMSDDLSSNPTAINALGPDEYKYDPSRYIPIQPPWIPTYPPAANPATNVDGTGYTESRICPNIGIQPVSNNLNTTTGLGKMKIKTKYNKNYLASTYDHNDTICNVNFVNMNVDKSFPEKYNVAAYPYEYTDISGNLRHFVYFQSRKTYDVSANGDNPGYDQIKLLQLTWGDLFGYSFAAVDNFKVVPTNGDVRKSRLLLGPNIDFKYVENWTNYIGVGAPNPYFQFDSSNKFQLANMNYNVYANSLLGNATSQLGEQLAIINQDLCGNFLMNSYVLDPTVFQYINQWNLGIQSEQAGIYIYKIHLPSKSWKKPDNIDLNAYWDNSSLEGTENNHAQILQNTMEANETNFSKTLMGRLGYEYYDLYPRYKGNVGTRFTQKSFNNTVYPESSASLVKTDNVLNAAANAPLNLFWDKPVLNRPNGTPYYGLGTNNQVAEFVQTSTDFIEASNEPQLSQAGFFNVISDIIPTNFNNGNGVQQNVVYQLSKSYTSGNYIYGGGSAGFPVYEPRTITKVRIEIRNPNTNELAKISPSSSITFRVVRRAVIPLPIPPNVKRTEDEKPSNDTELIQQLKKQQELLTEMVKEQKVENRNEREENDNIEEFLERNVNFEKVLEQFVSQFKPKPEVKPEAE